MRLHSTTSLSNQLSRRCSWMCAVLFVDCIISKAHNGAVVNQSDHFRLTVLPSRLSGYIDTWLSFLFPPSLVYLRFQVTDRATRSLSVIIVHNTPLYFQLHTLFCNVLHTTLYYRVDFFAIDVTVDSLYLLPQGFPLRLHLSLTIAYDHVIELFRLAIPLRRLFL